MSMQWMAGYALALMASYAPAPQAASGASASSGDYALVWAGHQVSLGTRRVPMKGVVRTRTDAFFLGRLERNGKGWKLKRTVCDVRMAPMGGVSVSLDARALPPSELVMFFDGEGVFHGRARTEWDEEDLDDDSHPGLTITVDAPVCSGSLYVANRATTETRAHLATRFLGGHAEMHREERILGAEGACLSLMAESTEETIAGPFAYVPVADDATCESLLAQEWPVDAM